MNNNLNLQVLREPGDNGDIREQKIKGLLDKKVEKNSSGKKPPQPVPCSFTLIMRKKLTKRED